MTSGAHDGLLPGELSDTCYPEDAEHWLIVYTELRQFAQDAALNSFVDLYERRLEFWQARLHELSSPSPES